MQYRNINFEKQDVRGRDWVWFKRHALFVWYDLWQFLKMRLLKQIEAALTDNQTQPIIISVPLFENEALCFNYFSKYDLDERFARSFVNPMASKNDYKQKELDYYYTDNYIGAESVFDDCYYEHLPDAPVVLHTITYNPTITTKEKTEEEVVQGWPNCPFTLSKILSQNGYLNNYIAEILQPTSEINIALYPYFDGIKQTTTCREIRFENKRLFLEIF